VSGRTRSSSGRAWHVRLWMLGPKKGETPGPPAPVTTPQRAHMMPPGQVLSVPRASARQGPRATYQQVRLQSEAKHHGTARGGNHGGPARRGRGGRGTGWSRWQRRPTMCTRESHTQRCLSPRRQWPPWRMAARATQTRLTAPGGVPRTPSLGRWCSAPPLRAGLHRQPSPRRARPSRCQAGGRSPRD
jgi:hypothetical protein